MVSDLQFTENREPIIRKWIQGLPGRLARGLRLPLSTWLLLLAYLAVFLLVLGIKLSFWAQAAETKSYPDTRTYLAITGLNVWSPYFWMGARPPTFPFWLKLWGGEAAMVRVAQCYLSTFSWLLLGLSLRGHLQSEPVRFLSFSLLLCLSLAPGFALWDGVLLSESLANSLLILCLAAWLWLLKQWRRPRVALVLSLTFLWVFCRDVHASVGLGVGLILLGLAARARFSKYGVLALGYLTISLLSLDLAGLAKRWTFPFHNIVGQRILPTWKNRSIFLENGMPLNDALMERSGTWAGSDGRAWDVDPKLRHFRKWRDNYGRKTYFKFLWLRLDWALQEPIRHAETMLDPSVWTYAPPGYPLHALPFPRALYMKNLTWIQILLAAFVLGYALTPARDSGKAAWWVAIVLMLTAYGHAFAVYHGDAMELARHSVGVALQLRLGFWLLVLLLLDHGLRGIKNRKKGQPK